MKPTTFLGGGGSWSDCCVLQEINIIYPNTSCNLIKNCLGISRELRECLLSTSTAAINIQLIIRQVYIAF